MMFYPVEYLLSFTEYVPTVIGDVLEVAPPAGGWGVEPVDLQLHDLIESQGGAVLVAPVVLPVTPF